jgi:hypothetical protein
MHFLHGRDHRNGSLYFYLLKKVIEAVTRARSLRPLPTYTRPDQSLGFRTLAMRARLNTPEQAGLSCSLLRTRQATMRLVSGMACWQSRMTSGVQAA